MKGKVGCRMLDVVREHKELKCDGRRQSVDGGERKYESRFVCRTSEGNTITRDEWEASHCSLACPALVDSRNPIFEILPL